MKKWALTVLVPIIVGLSLMAAGTLNANDALMSAGVYTLCGGTGIIAVIFVVVFIVLTARVKDEPAPAEPDAAVEAEDGRARVMRILMVAALLIEFILMFAFAVLRNVIGVAVCFGLFFVGIIAWLSVARAREKRRRAEEGEGYIKKSGTVRGCGFVPGSDKNSARYTFLVTVAVGGSDIEAYSEDRYERGERVIVEVKKSGSGVARVVGSDTAKEIATGKMDIGYLFERGVKKEWGKAVVRGCVPTMDKDEYGRSVARHGLYTVMLELEHGTLRYRNAHSTVKRNIGDVVLVEYDATGNNTTARILDPYSTEAGDILAKQREAEREKNAPEPEADPESPDGDDAKKLEKPEKSNKKDKKDKKNAKNDGKNQKSDTDADRADAAADRHADKEKKRKKRFDD